MKSTHSLLLEIRWHARFILLGIIILILTSCASGGYTLAEREAMYNLAYSHQDSVTVYQSGTLFTENDTIVSGDTLHYWK